jgi:MOSC domain-containing protein YiiM
MNHATPEELDAGLAHILDAPAEYGTLELIVRRPAENEREVLDMGQLDPAVGLEGDNWITRVGRTDAAPAPDTQLNVMSARVIELIAGEPERRSLAGDQLFVDFDISEGNLPVGARLAIGDAVIEVTAKPHTGCAKFSSRFGQDAMRWANSPAGRQLRLRGLNAKVVQAGAIRTGDLVRKI